MSKPTTANASPQDPETEYRAIEAALLESARGRWFLAEYARRNRRADLVAPAPAVGQIETGGSDQNSGDHRAEKLATSLAEMAEAIAQAAADLVEDGKAGQLTSIFENVPAILRDAESATSNILDAAEHIQETAWTLRERGIDGAVCDLLDGRSSEIYAACAAQDVAVKRIGRIVRTGRLLEERIRGLCADWGIRSNGAEQVKPTNQSGTGQIGPAHRGSDTGSVLIAAGAESTPQANAPPPLEESAPIPPAEDPKAAASARRRRQLTALADIDALATREKLRLFT